MKINVVSPKGKSSDITALPEVFSADYNEALLHEVVTSYRLNGRAGTSAQLSRSEVSGGGAKPWRQKGTGRARAGTSRSPIWRKGGVTFAAKNRDYHAKVNRKVYRQAMRVIFSELIRQDRLVVIDELQLEPRTKSALKLMQDLKLNNVLFITKEFNRNFSLAIRNLVNAAVISSTEINPVVMLQCDQVCITADAFKNVQEWLA